LEDGFSGISFFSPLILLVALNTELRDGRQQDQVAISRTVGAVAAQTIKASVAVSGIDDLWTHGVGRML
jgi:hypothetical protein